MTFDEIRNILKHKTVGIAGAGGLGSNCAVALARVGTGTLVIADFDNISESNLNRQYYFHDQIGKPKVKSLEENIIRINPAVNIIAHNVRLTNDNIPILFKNCHVIVEALDQADQKEMLIETVLMAFPEKPLVIGLGMAGWGNSNEIHCRQIDNMYICGDEVSEIAQEMPPIAPRVGMVANMQANVVVDILLTL
jgi:sulfur carrier protein ThiS adenylyltransferase